MGSEQVARPRRTPPHVLADPRPPATSRPVPCPSSYVTLPPSPPTPIPALGSDPSTCLLHLPGVRAPGPPPSGPMLLTPPGFSALSQVLMGLRHCFSALLGSGPSTALGPAETHWGSASSELRGSQPGAAACSFLRLGFSISISLEQGGAGPD